ncbi:hypothetical protein [Stenotrophomonas sp. YIM B13575]|uniref:hypothetical protein n=1 Tax=Stenotrophomonas sp. YIM B13575 TaxID=3366314 RepID=UPI0036906D82
MSTKLATGRNSGASSPAAGLVVVNDYSWPVEAAADGDLVLIGELPANHKLHSQGSGLFAKLDAAGKLAAQNVTVFIPEDADGAAVAGNTVIAATAVAADTAAFTPVALHLIAEALGSKPVNRPVYVKLNTAPGAQQGELILRLASFPA